MSRPRVAFVLTQDKGGPVDVAVALTRWMVDHGHDVRLFAPPPARGREQVQRVLHPISVPSKFGLSAMRQTRREINGFRPDIVHAQDRRAGLLCAGLGGRRHSPRVVHTYHGVPDDVEMEWLVGGTGRSPSWYTMATLAADSMVARTVDQTVIVAPVMRTFLRKRLRVPNGKLRHIDNGLYLPPVSASARLKKLLFVGMLIPRKGVHHLLDAMAIMHEGHPQLTLDIVGDGPERARLESQCSRLGLERQVRFLGFRTDVPELLDHADAFVLPSSMEQQPLVLIEALSAGKAVVATDVGGVADMLTGMGDAVSLVRPDDPAALARGIARLTTVADLGVATVLMAAHARERFSIDRCARTHLELYRSLT